MTRRCALVGALLAASGGAGACSEPEPDATAYVVIDAPPWSSLRLRDATVDPPLGTRVEARRAELLVAVDTSRVDAVRVGLAGACPLTIPGGELEVGGAVRRSLVPLLRVPGPQAQVGFDSPFEVVIEPGCDAAKRGTITWAQKSGAPVRDERVEGSGFRYAARSPRRDDVMSGELPWGIVPLSPRTRGEAVLVATWQPSDPKLEQVEERVVVSAMPRARGLPNVAVHGRLMLGGEGWRVSEAPPGAKSAVRTAAGATLFAPDRAGDWRLEDGTGRSLKIRAGTYSETPMDCGRAKCHVAATEASKTSPMVGILKRRMEGHGGTGAWQRDAGCALGCHATGEPGLDDGGFAHVMEQIGFSVGDLAGSRWGDLPRPLRRLGGVGCLSCHGPGAIPEASASWSVLRSDVCGYCHDAPPRYGHSLAWAESAMARADRDERARTDDACRRCHTTDGHLVHVGSLDAPRPAPEGVGPIGISCVACHTVHGHGGDEPSASLLREPPARPFFSNVPAPARARSGVCLECHSPRWQDDRPFASAAALWAGRGGLDPENGAAITGGTPHLDVNGGCVGCHSKSKAAVERGGSHGFAATRDQCATCHAGPPAGPGFDEASQRLRERAQDLARRLGIDARGEARPPHARERGVDRSTPRGRAAWNVMLVLEDRGAAEHNLPYARALLDTAERAIGKGAP